MTRRAHLRFLLMGAIAWLLFWVIGLPSYYQQYSFAVMVAFDALLLVPLTAVFLRMLSRVRSQRRLALSLWAAFYFTVPLAVYDWLYCGLFLGHGLNFLVRYWYLSIYYLIPWVLLPACAAWLNTTASVSAPAQTRTASSGAR